MEGHLDGPDRDLRLLLVKNVGEIRSCRKKNVAFFVQAALTVLKAEFFSS